MKKAHVYEQGLRTGENEWNAFLEREARRGGGERKKLKDGWECGDQEESVET
jgi:hypothetical protein